MKVTVNAEFDFPSENHQVVYALIEKLTKKMKDSKYLVYFLVKEVD